MLPWIVSVVGRVVALHCSVCQGVVCGVGDATQPVSRLCEGTWYMRCSRSVQALVQGPLCAILSVSPVRVQASLDFFSVWFCHRPPSGVLPGPVCCVCCVWSARPHNTAAACRLSWCAAGPAVAVVRRPLACQAAISFIAAPAEVHPTARHTETCFAETCVPCCP